MNSKKPRYKGRCFCEIPRWGLSQERSNDQNPSRVSRLKIRYRLPTNDPQDFQPRIDMDFTKAIPIFIPSIFTLSMTDLLRVITPLRQAVINRVFIGVKQTPFGDTALNDGLNRFLLHVIKHVEDDLPTPLYHAKDRRFIFLSSPSTAFTF